ncbi:MAG: hypothetical protein A2010_17110 [Nitrospirae bacterium GWD2_57_9]|nr:MAG: hypothetical protein A2010_17110 [Nitrospirae bacterium GWD2_57_9]
MKTLVIGSTGTVGSAVVQGLIDKGVTVRCMSRSLHKISHLPSGVEGIVADLDRPHTLRDAFNGVDSLFLLMPVNPNETAQGLHAVSEAKAAGISRMVYLSAAMPPGSDIIPHFRSKLPVEDAVKASGIPATILRPNNFFQNDQPIAGVIMGFGVYPTPLGNIGLNRVDALDVAEAAVNALTQQGHEGQTYSLHGPDVLTGMDAARIYSRYAGRDVRYAGDDLEVWERHVRNMLPSWLIRDLLVMYQYFQDHGMIAPGGDLEKQNLVLGREPRHFVKFVEELCREWKKSLACAA